MTEGTSRGDGVAKVAELVDDARICMFTTMTADGRHVSRPMALQDVEFDGDLWFFAYGDSPKVQQIRGNRQVNVSFANSKNSEWDAPSSKIAQALGAVRAMVKRDPDEFPAENETVDLQ